MKFICETSSLSTACQNVQRAVSAKSSIPGAEGIFIKAVNNELTLTGYDLEIGINTTIYAKVEEAGSIVLNAKVLCEILRRIPNQTITIESDERNFAVLRSGDIKYEIMGISADEFPELPSVQGGFNIEMDRKVLNDMVKQTIFAVAVTDQKVVYTGIKFEIGNGEIKLIAVDGFRMAIRTEKIDYNGEEITFIVPAKTMAEIMKLSLEENEEDESIINIGIGKRHIIFEVNGYSVISRLLEGEFLNYKATIPVSVATTVEVDTKSIIDSIERTSLIITDRTKSLINCVFDTDFIRISSITSIGTANDKVPADVEGNRVEIGFNNRYLLDALKACNTDRVKIQLNGSISPILILPTEGEEFIFLVLPVRLKKND
ncbi:MAG: DNA polymerase III subunit beta [Clostridia bacterium]|nr:DNA polymerase III subunit beta [Clostridia bacterium]